MTIKCKIIVLNSAFIFDKYIDLYINFDVADTVTFEKYKKDLSMMDKPEVREIVRVNVPLDRKHHFDTK